LKEVVTCLKLCQRMYPPQPVGELIDEGKPDLAHDACVDPAARQHSELITHDS
jgi:hypothetical protein